MYKALTASLAIVALLVIACTARTLVGQGTVDGHGWAVEAYPGENGEVCLASRGMGMSCYSIRPDQVVASGGLHAEELPVDVVHGLARPIVAAVQIDLPDGSVVIPTVALSFRSDIRAFAAGFPERVSGGGITPLDAQGRALAPAEAAPIGDP